MLGQDRPRLEAVNNNIQPLQLERTTTDNMGWKQILREEFRLKKLGFGDVYPGRFYMFQWCVPPIVFLLYRFILAAYVDVWMLYLNISSASNDQVIEGVSWAAFLTIWTYVVLSIYLTFHFLAAFVHYVCLRRQGTNFLRRQPIESHQNNYPETYSEPWGAQEEGYDPVPDVDMEMEFRLHKLSWFLKIVWVLYNVVSSSALMVTIIFFSFLFPQMNTSAATLADVQLHMLNSIIVFIEHLFSGIPIRLLHIVYPLSYLLVYVLFSVFYWIPDHKRVMYPNVLDWNKPGPTIGIVCLIGFVVVPVLHFVLFLIYRVKIAIYKRFC